MSDFRPGNTKHEEGHYPRARRSAWYSSRASLSRGCGCEAAELNRLLKKICREAGLNEIVETNGGTPNRVSRKKVATAVNVAEVYTKYEIGRYIVEDEQEENYKAAYGKQVLPNLSRRLNEKFGDGWSLETLKKCRMFYSVYTPSGKRSTLLTKSSKSKKSSDLVHTVDQIQNAPAEPHKFVLSWSHYLVLMRVDNPDARSFYEIECAKQNWTVRSSRSSRSRLSESCA